MEPKPELHHIGEFGLSLSVLGADGNKLPYKGFIEADVSVPSLGGQSFIIPVLVMSNTEFNSEVPAIIGTNVIRLCKESSPNNNNNIPSEWQIAFDSLCDDSIPVRTTNTHNIRVGPGEVKTLHGIVRNTKDIHTAVTEHIDSSLSVI